MKVNLEYRKVLLLLCCVFYFGCQPDGGDLTPVLQNGAKIASMQSKADNALQYDAGKFTLKIAGVWESLHGDVDFSMELRNLSSSKITIDLSKTIVANSLNANLKILSVVNRYAEGSPKPIENKLVEVGAGETQIYNIGVGEENRNYKDKIEYRGNEIWFALPVTVGDKTIGAASYNFRFKYDDYNNSLPAGERNNNN